MESTATVASQPGILVIIPTYNERDNLALILERLFRANPTVHALVVDDGSPDGTGELADSLAHKDDRISVMHRTEKNGLGAAYVAGFRWALAEENKRFDLIVEMDADGSHAPEQLPVLVKTISSGADVVLGSRYIPGGAVINWPMHREFLSRWGNIYVRLALGFPLHDITGGYRVYRREVLRNIDLDSVQSHGYCFQVDLAWRAYNNGATIAEVPITFTERERGESKMSGNIIKEALGKVTVWGIKARVSGIKDRVSAIKAKLGLVTHKPEQSV